MPFDENFSGSVLLEAHASYGHKQEGKADKSPLVFRRYSDRIGDYSFTKCSLDHIHPLLLAKILLIRRIASKQGSCLQGSLPDSQLSACTLLPQRVMLRLLPHSTSLIYKFHSPVR